ncbi:MAG: cupin domain-containing protein [Chloroflexi bacterium]|nr:cupin domain-containing protein [Chloroflexota bacterium]
MLVKSIDENSAYSDQKLKKNNLFDRDRMFCDVYCFEPGQEQRVHDHGGADKFYYVLEGSGTFIVDDDRRELGEGDLVLAPARSVHGVINDSGERLRCLVVMAPSPNF